MAILTECMKKILDVRYEDLEMEKNLCMQLLSQCEDKYMEAFGRTYLGDAYHALGQIDDALPEYSRALELAEENDYEDLLSVLYNSAGAIYMYNDDEQSALDYFFDGIRLAEKQENKMLHVILLANIAYIYRGAGAFDEAERMIDQVLGMIHEMKRDDPGTDVDEVGYWLDKIWMMLQKHETDEAWKLMQDDEIKNDQSRENYINFAIYYQQISDQQQCSRYIDAALAEVEHENNKFERIIYLLELIEIGIDAGLYLKADEIAGMAEEQLKYAGTAGKWTRFMEYRIEIYEALGKKEELVTAYEKYYEYDRKYGEEKAHAAVKRVSREIELMRELDRKSEIEQRQADLYDKRGMDELTGLYNRWGIRDQIGALRREYAGRDEKLTVAVVDVDFFKEYNDTYGHIAGDECLKSIADILKRNAGENSIAGRYGGDEFLLVMWGRSMEETERIFAGIKKELSDRKIENSKSEVSDTVTVTIGGIVTKLEENTDFTACIHEADLALYEGKKGSKNGYMVRNLG